jgi:hypothetical protein
MPVYMRRRAVLGVGAGILAFSFIPLLLAQPGSQRRSDLFVFPAPDTGNLILAVLVAMTGDRSASSTPLASSVRIHSGQRGWAIDWRSRSKALRRADKDRCFAGEVIGSDVQIGCRYQAAVIECPRGFLPAGEAVAVWAEIHTEDGTRFRVGNPFVAELLSQHPAFLEAYHAASPADDLALFGDELTRQISAMATAGGVVANPGAHARRLVARLLPDVIEYRSDLPVGFNFAMRNGRHPADNAVTVAATLLAGAAAPRTPAPFRLSDRFPYFQSVAA